MSIYILYMISYICMYIYQYIHTEIYKDICMHVLYIERESLMETYYIYREIY